MKHYTAEDVRAKQQEQTPERPSESLLSKQSPRKQEEDPIKKSRPGDMQIVDVIANHFGVDRKTAIGWIEEMKSDLVSAA